MLHTELYDSKLHPGLKFLVSSGIRGRIIQDTSFRKGVSFAEAAHMVYYMSHADRIRMIEQYATKEEIQYLLEA